VRDFQRVGEQIGGRIGDEGTSQRPNEQVNEIDDTRTGGCNCFDSVPFFMLLIPTPTLRTGAFSELAS
jgi:hypothetical protein